MMSSQSQARWKDEVVIEQEKSRSIGITLKVSRRNLHKLVKINYGIGVSNRYKSTGIIHWVTFADQPQHLFPQRALLVGFVR